MGYTFHYFLELPRIWGVGFACGLVVVYSAFGGIRAVTATDIVQFAVIVLFIPILTFKLLWYTGGGIGSVVAHVPQGHFQIWSHEAFWQHGFIFVVFVIPFLDPAFMQRLLMAKDARQAHDSMQFAGFIELGLKLFILLIAFSLFAINPNMSSSTVFFQGMDMVLIGVFKGIGMAGLLALTMSTADSFLHAAVVSLVHDVVQPLRITCPLPDKKELRYTRWATVILGIVAMGAAVSFKSIIDLVLTALDCWGPVVVIPLLAGIVGYYSSARSFAWAAGSGVVVTVAWKTVLAPYVSVGATVPGLLANLIAFSIARHFDTSKNIHYDPDDNLAELAKRRQEAREKERAEGKIARVTFASALASVGFGCLQWCRNILLTLWELVPTPRRFIAFCQRRGILYYIPYEAFAVVTIVNFFLLFLWKNPTEAAAQVVFGLQAFSTCLAFGLALHRHMMPQHWQHKQLPVYWCVTLALAWLITPTYGVLASKGHVGDFALWLTGVLLTAVLIDLQGFVRLATGCTLVGWVLYVLIDGQHGALQSLGQLPAWALLQGGMSIVVVSLFSRSREAPLQQQLQAYKIKEACTAHDLPAPLNKCQRSAEWLQEHLPDLVRAHKKLSQQDSTLKPKSDETYQELLQLPSKIATFAQRGKEFVREMLDETVDPFTATQQECNIAQCVRDALDYSDISVEELGRIRWRGGEFKVRARPYLMAHGIYNGVRNSFKHGAPGGIVEIWACQEDDMYVLVIRNEGSITAGKLLSAQEAFVTGGAKGGHGVGLSFCKLVAQLAGGDICLQSTPEAGVCLRFEFPIHTKK